jgi:hypothetical protein
MNERITTSQFPPIPEHQAQPRGEALITSHPHNDQENVREVQPNRPRDMGAERKRFDGAVITTHNIEQIQEENRKAEKKVSGKKEGK